MGIRERARTQARTHTGAHTRTQAERGNYTSPPPPPGPPSGPAGDITEQNITPRDTLGILRGRHSTPAATNKTQALEIGLGGGTRRLKRGRRAAEGLAGHHVDSLTPRHGSGRAGLSPSSGPVRLPACLPVACPTASSLRRILREALACGFPLLPNERAPAVPRRPPHAQLGAGRQRGRGARRGTSKNEAMR